MIGHLGWMAAGAGLLLGLEVAGIALGAMLVRNATPREESFPAPPPLNVTTTSSLDVEAR